LLSGETTKYLNLSASRTADLPEPYDHGYTLQGKSSGQKPIDSTDWSPSEAWTAGEIPGYNTYLFYNPEIHAVVVVLVNSDISSGKCPKGVPIMKEWPRTVPCELPADRIFEALGKPSPSPPIQ
jgi:CubicO group peptidase (beta-lactamase class C family)